MKFEECAKAVGECAFMPSELPVILSMEMHCNPSQQRMLATMMIEHIGEPLLQVSWPVLLTARLQTLRMTRRLQRRHTV